MSAREKWHWTGQENGWFVPAKSPLWLRLPGVRHIRFLYLSWRVEQYNTFWRSVGAVPTGYDSWVLWGVRRGWV